MQSRLVPILSMLIMLWLSGVSIAQRPSESGAISADTLRERIEQLEKCELNSRSKTVQEVYKQTLVRLYAEFSQALENDIADLRKIETTIRGTQSESSGEVAAQLKKLTIERDVVTEKLKTLKEDPDAVSLNFSRKSQSMLATTAPAPQLMHQPATASTVSESVAAASANNSLPAPVASPSPSPITFSGKVKIKNNGDIVPAKGAKVVFSKVDSDGDREAQADTFLTQMVSTLST